MNNRQRVFVEEYLRCWQATEAARRAGYAEKSAHVIGYRLLKNVYIAAEISQRLADLQMSANEVLTRLTEHARGTMADFINPATGELALTEAEKANRLHLIKKYTHTTTTITTDESEVLKVNESIELYDAQGALALLGRSHKLFVDRQEITGVLTTPIQIIEPVKPDGA